MQKPSPQTEGDAAQEEGVSNKTLEEEEVEKEEEEEGEEKEEEEEEEEGVFGFQSWTTYASCAPQDTHADAQSYGMMASPLCTLVPITI
jgi:hypothetical protein